jgi:predicted aspartyl protease
MSHLAGTFNDPNTPTISIEISGVNASKKFEAIIDTGFECFVSMPLSEALPLGLILEGVTTLTFADGSVTDRLTYGGRVTLGPRSRWGETVLQIDEKAAVLVGMEFLKSFELCLVVDPTRQAVSLLDTADAQDWFTSLDETSGRS